MLSKIKKIVLKKNRSKIVCLTAYSKNIASILDNHCDIVLVGDGTYNENLVIESDIILTSVGGHQNTIIDGSGGAAGTMGSTVTVRPESGSAFAPNNVEIDGFTITGGMGTKLTEEQINMEAEIVDVERWIGGGLFSYLTNANIHHNKLSNNGGPSVQNGGAIYSQTSAEDWGFDDRSIGVGRCEIEEININLTLRDKELQDQILKYQNLTTNLLELNESLGLQDADIKQQLLAIRKKNKELSDLNKGLLDKDKTIFDLRGKILELNNILSLSEDEAIEQTATISNLQKKISDLNTLNEIDKEQASLSIKEMELQSIQAFEQVASLSGEIDILKNEINILNKALESSEQEALTKDLKIEVLGERLNKALTSKVFELQKYRSEFFGKLQKILGQREDIKIVGDRFIFESELLFDSASADLQINGKEKLKEIGMTLKETTNQIPKDIDWIIQVEGHTDKRPIKTAKYPSNWELSTARANSVLKLLLELGFSPNKLSAAGYGEFYPISDGENEQDYQQNRRIELRLTSR